MRLLLRRETAEIEIATVDEWAVSEAIVGMRGAAGMWVKVKVKKLLLDWN